MIGDWMEARDHDRSKLIIATKCGNHDIKGNVNAPGLSRHNIIRSVEICKGEGKADNEQTKL